MIHELKDFKRIEIFKHYHSCDNPFLMIVTPIDVTKIVNYCKINKNFYATLGYLVTKTANEIDNFKYRYNDGKFYYCDEVKSNYTQMRNDESIGYFDLPSINNYSAYIKKFVEIQDAFMSSSEYFVDNDIDEIWISCIPWFSFSGIVTPFNKNITIPQFTWDKYIQTGNTYHVNLSIMIHHGFADGFHIAKFIKLLQQNINNFNG